MSPRSFGIEAITDEDRAYGGSRFCDVREALFANPYQRIWGAHGEPPLPVHPVTLMPIRRRRMERRRRAAEQRDELAAPHSITSSARASNAGGTVRPSVRAVW